MIRRTRRGNILTNRHVQSINCWLYLPVGTPNAFSPQLPASYGLQAASVLSTGAIIRKPASRIPPARTLQWHTVSESLGVALSAEG